MEKYSKAVSEMYSQFEKREVHPMEKYIGRLVSFSGEEVEVVGYNRNELADEPLLIIDASQVGGWTALEPFDVVFKDCKYYWYASINDLMEYNTMEKFEKGEPYPMEKYIGRLAKYCGEKLEVVGYSYDEEPANSRLIVDASQIGGWTVLEPGDVVFKECEGYWYVSINDLID